MRNHAPHPAVPTPIPTDDPAALTLAEVAMRLDVDEAEVRGWLTTFNWERRYDAAGNMWLTARDAEFLRLVKSLRDVDRSCASITRLLAADRPADDLAQIETLKAELLDLHARPARKPFWRFWAR